MNNDGTPAWFNSPVKWREDVMVPATKRQGIIDAWYRLYGTPFGAEVEVEVYDGGDCRATLYESGRISISGDGADSQIRELPPGSEKPKRRSPAAALLADAGYRDQVQKLPPKTEPKLPYKHFQVAVVDDGMNDVKNLLFVLDEHGEVWVKEINKNGVATSSAAVWVQSR